MISIRGHFDGKVIVPDEPVTLPLDQALTVLVEPLTPPVLAGESCLEWLARHAVDAPEIAEDLAHQHDHYLYGSPKRE